MPLPPHLNYFRKWGVRLSDILLEKVFTRRKIDSDTNAFTTVLEKSEASKINVWILVNKVKITTLTGFPMPLR